MEKNGYVVNVNNDILKWDDSIQNKHVRITIPADVVKEAGWNRNYPAFGRQVNSHKIELSQCPIHSDFMVTGESKDFCAEKQNRSYRFSVNRLFNYVIKRVLIESDKENNKIYVTELF